MSRVLYVEDDTLLQVDGEACLTDAGYEVLTASDGPEAWAYLRQYGDRLDALITDIDLPGGLNGWQLATMGREMSRHLPVLYVTGGGGLDFGASGVARSLLIPKPFEWTRVLAALATLLPGESPVPAAA